MNVKFTLVNLTVVNLSKTNDQYHSKIVLLHYLSLIVNYLS